MIYDLLSRIFGRGANHTSFVKVYGIEDYKPMGADGVNITLAILSNL